MTARKNARDAIREACTARGFRPTAASPEDADTYALGDGWYLRVHYKLFGGLGAQRMCRWYGQDHGQWLNWGVDRACVRRFDREEIDHVFEGKNKRGQIVRWIKLRS